MDSPHVDIHMYKAPHVMMFSTAHSDSLNYYSGWVKKSAYYIGSCTRVFGVAFICFLGREPDLALVPTKAKKFSLRFLFSWTIGT